MLAACSSSKGASPTHQRPARCAAYEAMSKNDLAVKRHQSEATMNWTGFRTLLVAGNTGAEAGYRGVAAATKGQLRADAQLVASFVPRSRAVLERSRSLAEYLANVRLLPGDT